MENEKKFINLEEGEDEKKKQGLESTESFEIEQEEIAQKFLREYENWKQLKESHSRALQSLNSAREESVLTKEDTSSLIKKLEGERGEISELMNQSQTWMNELSGRLTEKSKEKYLKG